MKNNCELSKVKQIFFLKSRFVLWSFCDILRTRKDGWDRNPGFKSNKPIHYLLDYGGARYECSVKTIAVVHNNVTEESSNSIHRKAQQLNIEGTPNNFFFANAAKKKKKNF